MKGLVVLLLVVCLLHTTVTAQSSCQITVNSLSQYIGDPYFGITDVITLNSWGIANMSQHKVKIILGCVWQMDTYDPVNHVYFYGVIDTVYTAKTYTYTGGLLMPTYWNQTLQLVPENDLSLSGVMYAALEPYTHVHGHYYIAVVSENCNCPNQVYWTTDLASFGYYGSGFPH